MRGVADFLSIWTLKIFNVAKNPYVLILSAGFLLVVWYLQSQGLLGIGGEAELFKPNTALQAVQDALASVGQSTAILKPEVISDLAGKQIQHWYTSGFAPQILSFCIVCLKYTASAFLTVGKVLIPATIAGVTAKSYLQKRADELKKGVVTK